jgi:hypothetical protein
VNKKLILSSFLSLILSFMFLATFCLVTSHAATSWNIQTVDANGAFGSGVSTALDSKDKPHLCYIAYVDGYYRNPAYLTYASWNGSDWNIQNVTANIHSIGYTSLALDSNDNPHITYEWGELKYASWTGEDWNIQNVGSERGLGSLVLDSADRPHIICGGANGTLKYAVLKDSN